MFLFKKPVLEEKLVSPSALYRLLESHKGSLFNIYMRGNILIAGNKTNLKHKDASINVLLPLIFRNYVREYNTPPCISNQFHNTTHKVYKYDKRDKHIIDITHGHIEKDLVLPPYWYSYKNVKDAQITISFQIGSIHCLEKP